MKPLTDKEIQEIAESFSFEQLPSHLSEKEKEETANYQMLMDALQEPPGVEIPFDFTDQVMNAIAYQESQAIWKELGIVGGSILLAVLCCIGSLLYVDILAADTLINTLDKFKYLIVFTLITGIMVQFGERILFRLGVLKF